jgi:hypothetical protein
MWPSADESNLYYCIKLLIKSREFMANAEAEEKKSHGNNVAMDKKDAGR